MKKIFKKIILLSLLTILPYSIFTLSDNVFAQSKNREILRISPFVFDVTLSPNKTYEYEMTVENLLSVPLPVRLTSEDFMISEDTGDYSFEDNNINSVTSWITIEPKDAIIPANGKQVVNVTIQTPKQISFGGYHGMVFVQPVFPQQKEYNSFLTTKVGALILANIGSPANGVNPARVPFYRLPYFVADLNRFEYQFKVQSNSLYHFTARPFLHINPFIGKNKKVDLEEKLIFPGKTRSWEEVKSLPDLVPGIYSGELKVSLGNGVQTSNMQYFIYLPHYLSLIILSIGLIFIVVFNKRKAINKWIRQHPLIK